MQTYKDTQGDDYVSVEELQQFLLTVEDRVSGECSGAPDGCAETRAYLYGEICAIRTLRRAVQRWRSAPAQPFELT